MSKKPPQVTPTVEPVKAELVPVPRDENGRWLPGRSPNPGGCPVSIRELTDGIRARIPEVIERLFEIARTGKPGAPATVRAAEILIERCLGKTPIQLQDENGNKLRAAVIILPADGGEE